MAKWRLQHKAEHMSEANNKRKYESPRQIARQSKILAVARDMLDSGGYDGLTMRGLAKEAGVAQGTLYNLYGSKDDLIMAAVDDLLTALNRETRRRTPEPGLEALLTNAVVTGENIVRRPAYAEAMTRIVMSIEPESPLVDLVFARAYPATKESLDAAKKTGEIREDVDTDSIAKHIAGNSWTVILLWIMGMISLDQIVTERTRSMLLTLISVATEPKRTELEQRLAALQTINA